MKDAKGDGGMTENRKKISKQIMMIPLLLAIILTLGCTEEDGQIHEGYDKIERIEGKPLSCVSACGIGISGEWTEIAVVIQTTDGERKICVGDRWLECNEIVILAARIEAEINDNDDESITLIGGYVGETFKFYDVMESGNK